jgi:hypothetical protein
MTAAAPSGVVTFLFTDIAMAWACQTSSVSVTMTGSVMITRDRRS